jgi:endonuclease/exonuclease/phosphatase family metal-dependent hydrolase
MKIVTWNTQWCRGLDGTVSPQRIVEQARALADFDVLCLQEIAEGYRGMPGSPGDQPAQLEALLPGFRVVYGPAVDEFDRDGRRQRFGNLIATRLPLHLVRHHPLPWPAEAGLPSMPRACTVVTLRDAAIGPVRVMTTHLEYFAKTQRMAQAQALRALHAEACALAATPPAEDENVTDSPFQRKVHTPEAVLCGDFNFGPDGPEYALFQNGNDDDGDPHRLVDAWPFARANQVHQPTFCVYERTYAPEPIACDFFFVSASLASRVRGIEIDSQTQASDHQPVLLELG